jgi:hypothetical protein
MPDYCDKYEEQEFVLADGATLTQRRLSWCETDEDYEAVMSEIATQECRWS